MFVEQLTFLAITVGFRGDELCMQQHQYVLTKLKDRGLQHGKGKACQAMPSEGKLLPEMKDGKFEKVKKEAQTGSGHSDVAGIEDKAKHSNHHLCSCRGACPQPS